jgi:uncharacterized protein (TIGR03118 family)
VGDVGQNDVEEIDIVQRGGNYGWPIKEGMFLFANRTLTAPPRGPAEGAAYQFSPGFPRGLIDPIAEYDHADAPDLETEVRVAIVGGYVYRGHRLKDLKGHYVFGDYSGEIGTPVAGHLYFLDKQNQIKELIIPSRIGFGGKTALGLAVLGFGQDTQGELYLLANRSGTLADPDYVTFPGTSGGVFKLVPAKDKAEHYRQSNLVSDIPGLAMLDDPDLVNAWGISFSPTSPFWISDNGTGKSTLYAVTNDALGMVHVAKQGLVVTIPGEGNPTGQLFNGTGGFHGDIFIFASEDGTISGWRGALGTAAEVLVARPTALYKGITLATTPSGPVLLAANFSEGTIDMYRTDLSLIGQFADPHAPAGYAPFNVQDIAGTIVVTFAKQDAEKHDDVPGRGHGLIDTFDPQTGLFTRFATGKDAGGKLKEIDSPWGVALAPVTFGKHAGELLVGNFGSGTIMAFDPMTGKFRGLLECCDDEPVVIDGLWGLAFGNGGRAGRPGTLYFTAGPAGESHGLFGSLEPVSEHDDD